ncbi:hypothetical protein DdX_15865 [Ditylenchus destructor]|uniref:Uncharacterized protein n=1 Tax=Ditylenchus destructor TaxID=166010 RepID=A0AAD4MQ37_9BILA|nr:hypothetical protein DdX_15865 [Ditylenchus destructor]
MWISSSPSKNRSDRGRIDVFFRGLNWILKASLLILALASFSVAAADSVLPKDCYNPDTCFAKTSNELRDGPRDDIGFENNGEITWNASEESSDVSKIELYKDKECDKLSFIMDMPAESGKDCKFSMLFSGCVMDIEWKADDMEGGTWKELEFKYVKKGRALVPFPVSPVNVDLEDGNLTCTPECSKRGAFCDFETQKDGGWCKFDFAFKKTGNCDGTVRFDQKYKLLAKVQTTAAPETSPTTEASSLAPWVIILIVVLVLVLVLGGIGFLVFWICRRKRRRSAQNMAEKGMGSDCQCESTIPPPKSPIKIPRNKKSGSEMVDEPSTKEQNEDGDGSKLASKVEAEKPISQMKKNVPETTPENKPNRILAPDEVYEPLGDPAKAVPMHLSEKKISEKKPGRIKFTGRNREKAEAIRKAMEEEKKKKQVT